MTYNEIAEFVDIKHPITYVNSKTEIKFKNTQSIYGYFDKQTQEQRKLNKWSFIIQPQDNNAKEVSVINGDDVASIHLHIFSRQ